MAKTETIEVISERVIIDKAPLIYSNRFHNYLNNMKSIERLNGGDYHDIEKLSNKAYQNHDISFIDITDKEDTISFININRIFKYYRSLNPNIDKKTFSKYIDTEASMYSVMSYIKNYKGVWNFGRDEMKIGKFIKKMFPDLTDKAVEIFVNKYKALYRMRMSPKLEIVKGEEITKYYNQANYLHAPSNKEGLGTLGKSCMRHGYDYFHLYTKNPEVCSLLILKSPENDSKIIARALIWKLESGEYYMDRIYTHFDSDVYIFRNYAKERGWETHHDNCKRGSRYFKHFTVSLNNTSFDEYPYMDTFFIMSKKAKKISSDKIANADDLISIRQTDGGYSRIY